MAAILITIVSWSTTANASSFTTSNLLHFRWGVGLIDNSSGDTTGKAISFEGPGRLDSVQFGGYLNQEISLFMETSFLSTVTISNSVNSESFKSSGDFAHLTGFGFGYRFLQSNLYLSTSFGAACNTVNISSPLRLDEDSDVGFGFNTLIGKEWQIEEKFALGVSGQFLYMVNPGSNNTTHTPHTIASGLLVSVSYN